MPNSLRRRASDGVMSRPSNVIVPETCEPGISPASPSISSVCPLPSTPAMPTISAARTSNERLSRRFDPSRPTIDRSRTPSKTAPGFASGFSTRSSTSRPTIKRANSAAFVSVVFKSPTTRPSRITVTLSEMARTSESLCVMITIVLPCSRIRRRMAKNSSTSCGVKTAVGSSNINSWA